MKPRALLLMLILALAGGVVWKGLAKRHRRAALAPAAATTALTESMAHPGHPDGAETIIEALRSDLTVHRKLILLFADEANLQGPARDAAMSTGHQLHHERVDLVGQLDDALTVLTAQPAAQRDPVVSAVLDWMERDPEVFELDRLAFRDPLRVLQHGLAQDGSPEGTMLKTRIVHDLAEVDRIEGLVESEYRQVFGGPGHPAQGGERKRWNDYVKALKSLYPEVGAGSPSSVPPAPSQEARREINGQAFPEKVLVLSFDDGPHRVYTEEIKAILQHYQAPAVFFEVGRNIGAVEASGAVKLTPLSALTEDLVKSGYIVGNHSYTHALLSKETGKPLDTEIGETDSVLRAIPGAHSQLFRFPYGARTGVQMQALEPYHLRSVLWNIDSLDWADPVPSSVADRVIRAVSEEKRGIILFHDIHDRAGKVLPALVERLQSEGYRFAGLDGNGELVLPSR